MSPAPLRLRTGAVTVLLGPAAVRRQVLGALDEQTARCAAGHGQVGVRRLAPRPDETAAARVQALEDLGATGCALLLAQSPTVGLSADERRHVLGALRALSRTGTAVLVDDVDPVAALAVADAGLRTSTHGAPTYDDLSGPLGAPLAGPTGSAAQRAE